MIPASIDHIQILDDLNGWGIRDFKIEMICAFSVGYVAQLRCGNIEEMGYRKAARLYNFWFDERERQVPHGNLQTHTQTGATGAG